MPRMLCLGLAMVACAPSVADEGSSNRVTLRAGFDVTENALVLETLDVVDLTENTSCRSSNSGTAAGVP